VATHDDWNPETVDLVRPEDIFRLTNIPMILLLCGMLDPALPPYRTDRHGQRWYRWPDIDAYAFGDVKWTEQSKNPDGSAQGLGPLPDDHLRAQAK
jgi:hypothetical protein